ncbi:regulatory protein CII [Escherichia coli]|nr:regulatory protein CII [Escherichia coli]GDL51280.1 regulatory protein CII [Escherichia coli]GDM83290.1 regulatory protein CII [Escherichia coli]CAD6117600.1 bacteriophage regulatory protein CII [Escherichia coli]
MQPLTYQQTSGFSPTAVINRSQTKQAPGHEKSVMPFAPGRLQIIRMLLPHSL